MELNLNNKNEVLDRLEHLRDLVYQSSKYRDYAEEGCYKESLEKIEGIKKDLGALPNVPSVFSNMPVYPTGEKEYEEAQKKYAFARQRLMIVGIGTVVCFLFSSLLSFLTLIGIIGGVATAVFASGYSGVANGFKRAKTTYDQSMERYNSTMQAFRTSLSSYEEEVKAGGAAAKEYAGKCHKAYAAYNTVLTELVQGQEEANANFMETYGEFKRLNFLPDEYNHLIPNLITLLKSGRADSYKEALNLAIQEEKEEQMEAARRAEDERRTQILAEQAAEEQRHNAAMERAEQEKVRAEQARAKAEQDRAQVERDRANAEERARRDAARADSAARSNAYQNCVRCAKHDGCRNRGIPGCGAFVPKR